jgi:asparagine synthase (glutamine-hydrolysing)
MCGLTGFCDFNKKLTKDDLSTANEVLRHRGPDSGNVEVFETDDAIVGFGHRRLSILDVSENGSQPMFSDDKSVVVVLNGEVYNFKEIRKDLIESGYSFHSDSDTEVIIKAYQKYGISAVSKFIGMFAIALYDMKDQAIYLLRDRPGVKPLYYYYDNGTLLFASELKSIYTYPGFEKKINEIAISLFFNYGYIRAPHTIFEKTYKVQPGHYIKINLKNRSTENVKYWDVFDYYNKPKLKISEDDALQEVESLFTSAFQYRMVSDVPVGVFLSGGYDSSVVSAVLQKNSTQKIKTFTIGFSEEKWNEAPHAKKIAEHLGTDHHEYYCTTKEAQDIFPKLADIYDEPFGDSSGIPTTLVSQFARKQVTVSLSADGGDEIFAGYSRYDYLHKLNTTFKKTPGFILSSARVLSNTAISIAPGLKKVHKIARLSEILNTYKKNGLSDIYCRHFNYRDISELVKVFDPNAGLLDDVGTMNEGNDFMNKIIGFDYKTYLVDDVLTKVDRATMSVGLEGREPLLDHRIIEFVSQLPSELKYNNGEKKYLLKKIVHKYIPKELMDRPKAGFTFPMNEWLTTDLKDYLFNYINEEQLAKHNYINAKKAIAMRDDFAAGKKGMETQIWLILMFQMWWNRWMN